MFACVRGHYLCAVTGCGSPSRCRAKFVCAFYFLENYHDMITHQILPNQPNLMFPDYKERAIRAIVRSSVESYAAAFSDRHIAEYGDEEGTINMKIHNIFISVLGPEIQYYSALARSLDSSLGNMLEKMAINIAGLSYDVKRYVEGPLSDNQTHLIADILEQYKTHERKPHIADYSALRRMSQGNSVVRRHESDYYLIDNDSNIHYLIELKIGGDLDNKKARSEKEAILEQYSILSNTLPSDVEIKVCFATAYNRYGENKRWNQGRVRQFFADEELYIGRDFWNLICKTDCGYDIVIDEYRNNAHLIVDALNKIQAVYLSNDRE